MALNDDFSYKLGDNGVVLNPNSVTFPFVDVEKISGLDNAPYRTTERQHEGADGSFMDAEFEKGRSIIIDGTLFASHTDGEVYLDSLKANYAPSRTLIPFYFKKPGVQERFLRVKPLGVKYDVEQLRRIGQTNVQFSMFAEDPRIYNSGMQTANILQEPIVNTGRSYNKSYNYSYGPPILPSGQNLIVTGNRSTPVILIISGPAAYPKIINETVGMTLDFDILLGNGESLTIDTQYHTVRINGTENRRATMMAPNWFSLVPGNNFIRYRSSISGSSSVTAQWYNAWR